MNLNVVVDGTLRGSYKVNLPQPFLNMLLETEFGSIQKCVSLKSSNGCEICVAMKEFTDSADQIYISDLVAEYLQISDNAQIQVKFLDDLPTPYVINVQADRESFGLMENVREKLESYISVSAPCLNKNMSFSLDGEKLYIRELYGLDMIAVPYALTECCDLHVNFLETVEAEEIKKVKEAQKVAESTVVVDTGNRLGGRTLTREEQREHRLRRYITAYNGI